MSSNVNHPDSSTAGTVSRRVMRGFSAARLLEARTDAKLTRNELGRLANVTESAIGRWEKGIRSPQIDVLVRVLDQLGKSVEDIVDIAPDDRYPGDWRIIRGLTQPLLGRVAGVSTAAIGRIERGEGGLTPDVERRVAAALEITPEELRKAFGRARLRPKGEPA